MNWTKLKTQVTISIVYYRKPRHALIDAMSIFKIVDFYLNGAKDTF